MSAETAETTRDEIIRVQKEIVGLVRATWNQQATLLGMLIENLVHIQAEVDRITATLEPGRGVSHE